MADRCIVARGIALGVSMKVARSVGRPVTAGSGKEGREEGRREGHVYRMYGRTDGPWICSGGWSLLLRRLDKREEGNMREVTREEGGEDEDGGGDVFIR